MAKIYNEVIIDMNPDSSTFEETLYEDSFEHDGELMLMMPDELRQIETDIDGYIEDQVDERNTA